MPSAPSARFGLALIASVAVACGGTKHGQAIGNESRTGGGADLTAAYLCSIEDGGYRYPQMPCVVKNVGDGRYVLAKLAGSQRFRGEVHAVGGGFSFDGEYYCPWGDCTQPMHGEFVRRPSGELVGRFRDSQVIVRLVPAPQNVAWGGTSYGGDAYGGFGYGGWGYGGSSYGMQIAKPPSRRKRRPC
jgi:hypothetical protein